MKILLWVVLVAATNAVPPKVEQDRMFREAAALAAAGKYAEAEQRLRRLAEWQPDNPYVRHALGDVQARREAEANDPARLLRDRLARTRVGTVNFRAANPRDVVAALLNQATNVNWVWMVPAEANLPPLTLSLRDVPLAEALRYVTELAGLRYRVDANAIVIYQPAPEPKNAPAR
jgi:hypothetical protein